MSLGDTAKSVGMAFAFSAFAWLSDTISIGLASLQQAVGSSLVAAIGNPIGALVSLGTGLTAWISDRLFGTGIIETTQGLLAAVFASQMILALFTLCVFYAIALASPKGTYSVGDCLIAAGIFLLESIPLMCGFTAWGGFAAYLKRREISGVAGKLTSAVGLPSPEAGGILSKTLKTIKK